MGATFAKLQKKIQGKAISADWRNKEFYIKEGEQENLLLVKVMEDLCLEWNDDGVRKTGFSGEELTKAVA